MKTRFGFAIAAAVVIWTTATGQAPDEVRLSSHSYHPRPVFHSNVELVTIDVVLRNASGKSLAGFQADDFEVLDGGKRREIEKFDIQQTATDDAKAPQQQPIVADGSGQTLANPLSQQAHRVVELFFDDLYTQPEDFNRAKVAALRFLAEPSLSNDDVGIYTASKSQVVEPSRDHTAAVHVVTTMTSHARVSPAGLASCPQITPHQAYEIVNFNPIAYQAALDEYCLCSGSGDAKQCTHTRATMQVFQTGSTTSSYSTSGSSIDQKGFVMSQAQATWDQARLVSQDLLTSLGDCISHLSAEPSKRVMVLTSSGFLSGSLENEVEDIIAQALRANIVINALDAKGLYAQAPGRPISDLQQATPISTDLYETQSQARKLGEYDAPMAEFAESTGGLFFRNNNDLDLGFREAGLAPEVTYLLAIKPASDGKYHKLNVKLKERKHGELIEARPGYFASEQPKKGQPSSEAEALDAAVTVLDRLTGIPVQVDAQESKSSASMLRISITMAVDASVLPFQSQNGRQNEKLNFVAALFSPRGQFVTGKEAEMDLALKSDTRARLSKSGINGVLSLDVPPGDYRLRTVVRESVQGKVAAETRNLHVE